MGQTLPRARTAVAHKVWALPSIWNRKTNILSAGQHLMPEKLGGSRCRYITDDEFSIYLAWNSMQSPSTIRCARISFAAGMRQKWRDNSSYKAERPQSDHNHVTDLTARNAIVIKDVWLLADMKLSEA